jgi:hypothetical protein
MKMHFRDIRLLNNAGMEFPACYANTKLLDMNKSYLQSTSDYNKVDCKKCLKIMSTTYKWIYPK